MTGIGATSPSGRVPTNDRNRPFSVTQLRIRNGSSCPIPAVRRHHKDRSRRWEAVIRSLAIGWQRCASYGHYRGLGTARPAMNLGLSYLLGATSHSDPDHPNEQVVSKLNRVQPASIGKSSK